MVTDDADEPEEGDRGERDQTQSDQHRPPMGLIGEPCAVGGRPAADRPLQQRQRDDQQNREQHPRDSGCARCSELVSDRGGVGRVDELWARRRTLCGPADNAGPRIGRCLFAREHRRGLAFEVEVRLAADINGDAVDRAAGERVRTGPRVVVGDGFAAVATDA